MTALNSGERVQIEVTDRRDFDIIQIGEIPNQVLSPIATADNGNFEFAHCENISLNKIMELGRHRVRCAHLTARRRRNKGGQDYCTVRVALAVVTRYLPEIFDEVWERTVTVETVNVVLFAPAGIVAVDGTVATDVLLLVSETTAPFGGAPPFRVRVAVDEAPPITVVGFKVSEIKDATFTVRVVVFVVVP